MDLKGKGAGPPRLCKWICLVMYSDEALLEEALTQLQDRFGQIDHRAPAQDWNFTDHYAEEMGSGLKRVLVSFQPLGDPAELAPAKFACIALEAELALNGKRRVNLDIGYLDLFKVVLASVKRRTSKQWIPHPSLPGQGIWSDWVLHFTGGWTPFPWSFAGFKTPLLYPDLQAVRERFKNQLRDFDIGEQQP